MTQLRTRFIEDMQLRGLSENTVKSYVRAVRQYAEFFDKSPDQLSSEQVRQYLLYLINEKNVAQGTYNQVLAAIRLLYQGSARAKWLEEREADLLPVPYYAQSVNMLS